MKKVLLIILVVSTFAACKKNKVTRPFVSDGMLIGKWELHSRTGGNIIPPDTTYQPGNGNILQFNADSSYKRYTNGTLSQSGIFHTRIYISASMTAIRRDKLYFDNDSTAYSLVFTNGGMLYITSFVPDVGETSYDKIAN